MSIWGSLASAGAAVFGTMQNNKNINKQISAQRQENEKMRKYNLDLAKMQNEWNRNQWQMENAYNSPSAQIERMREAGLNPNMMYGGGVSGNLSASSPSMSSGAAATPMDFSSLANKKTVGDAIMQTLAVEQARANVRKTNAEADIQESDSTVRDRLNSLGLEKAELDNSIARELDGLYNSQRNLLDLNADAENWKREMRKEFGREYVSAIVKKLSNEADISEQTLKLEIETLAQRIVGINAENTPLVNLSGLSNSNMKLVLEILRTLLK